MSLNLADREAFQESIKIFFDQFMKDAFTRRTIYDAI